MTKKAVVLKTFLLWMMVVKVVVRNRYLYEY